MGGKSTPKAPDYSELAAFSQESAEMQMMLGLEQLDWAKKQWADQKGYIDEVIDTQLPMMKEQWETAKADRDRYEKLYQPIEESYLEQAQQWGSPEQMAEMERRTADRVAKAQSDIAQQFEAQRRSALQRLEGYGVDPSQTRNAALDVGVRMDQAKAMAQGAQQQRDLGYEAADQRER